MGACQCAGWAGELRRAAGSQRDQTVPMCDIYVTTVWGSSFWGCEGVEQSSERLDFVCSVGVVGGGKENERAMERERAGE